jgi:hypothetical protein
MKLQEVIPFKYTIVEKQKRAGVLLTLEGTFQRADTKNANGRVYPRSLWKGIMDNKDINDRLSTRRMLGELDHPANGSTSLSRVSHIVTEHQLLPDGVVKGRLDILNTPSGQIAATLVEAGVQVGVSSRGDGSVEKKGDESEVQNDFRLETYDIVLKPSTPGAYPQIAESEEDAKENLSLIAQAVEGLVKSTDDVDVLLECHKIISVLEGCESQCESILGELKQKLGSKQVQEQDGDREQGEETRTSTEENDMSGKSVQAPSDTPPGITLSPEMRDYLQEWVQKGVTEAVAVKETEINKLNVRIVELTEAKEGLEKKVSAAEQLIDEFTRKVKDLEGNKSTDEELKARYDAATALLDESISRLQEFGEVQRRLTAAEELLTSSILRHQMESVACHIEDKIDDLDEDMQKRFRSLLAECATAEAVDEKFTELSSLVENLSSGDPKPPVKEPLPSGSTVIQEDVVSGGGGNKIPMDYITQRILRRVG